MKLKVLLLGKNGQIGSDLEPLLHLLGEVLALGHQELDLADAGAIRRTLRDLRPSLIVNAAAYTAVDRAEKEGELAQAVNADAPAVLAEEAKKTGAALVHYSTDYVFDGGNRTPYEESDNKNPINVYGRTKLEGEQAIQDVGVPYLIFRTEWVFATRGKNFLLTILRLASREKELRVVDDQIGSPTWSRMIAVATTHVLARIFSAGFGVARVGEFSGVYHLTAGGQTSWYDFARAILEECSDSSQLGSWFAAATGCRQMAVPRVLPIPTSDYPTPARRPAYSVLSNAKLGQVFGLQLPDWRSQLTLAVRDAAPEVFPEISIPGPSERLPQ